MTMASKDRGAGELPKDLELVQDGVRIVSLTFGIKLYTDLLFSKIPDAVLGCYDRYLKLFPGEGLKFYATENMSQHKPVAKRTLDMPRVWLKPGAPAREYVAIELHDGETFNAMPHHLFQMLGNEPGSLTRESENANLVFMTFPAEEGLRRSAEFQKLVQELCEIFPFTSGHAGFTFVCSKYEQRKSNTFAWQKSMRHPGIDISLPVKDGIAAGFDGLKTVGWLTLVSDALAKKAGGEAKIRKALTKEIEVIPVKGGLMIKAGPAPRIGDTNRRDPLDDYRQVYRALKPVLEAAIARSKAISIAAPDFAEKSIQWFRRFEDA
jgi:hypothetical protein